MQDLNRYSAVIEDAISKIDFPQTPNNLYDPLRYFLLLGGKRMRPILTLLGAEAFGKSFNNAIPAALSVELFHNFSK